VSPMVREVRSRVAWRLDDLARAVSRLAHRVSDEVPGVGDPTPNVDTLKWVADRMGIRTSELVGRMDVL
jgi:hypothetical protein